MQIKHATLPAMPKCDVLDCTQPMIEKIPALGVKGGRLRVCESHRDDLDTGKAFYNVDAVNRKLLLRYPNK
jgi:hypothetical protein